MSGATFDDVSSFGLLKELYYDDVTFQENVMSSLKSFIKHADSEECNFDGNAWNVPIQLQLNTSYGILRDGEPLPASRVPKSVFAKYAAKLAYSTVEVTTFAATRGHRGGRPDGKYLDSMVKGTLLNILANIDFDLYANGRGYRATILTATPGQTNFTVTTSMRLQPGAIYDWYDSTYTTKRGSIGIDVKSIDRINRRVYIDTTFGTGAVPAGATAGDVLVVYGALNPNEPTDGRGCAGLSRIVDNTLTLGGYASSTYAAWAATNINAALANPSETLLQQFWDSMYQISQQYPDRLVINPNWKRAYLLQFLNQRRFTSNTFDTGASTLSFSPVKMGTDEKGKKPPMFEILEDKNCPPDTVYLFNSESIKIGSDYQDSPHLADEDDREFRMRLGYDAMQGFFRYWYNTIVFQRNAIGSLYGFATPSGVL